MSIFDFITDEDFRKSLEADFIEMTQCFQAKSWKSVHVLAGSIVETILIDHLIIERHMTRDEALKIDLGGAINLCKEKKVITQKTADLSSVVKSYRNLIHPGRLIRLNEDVTQDSAEVAKALVSIVATEIERQRKQKYGYTAEQIVAKIQRDSSVDLIVGHLIREAHPNEVERLLLKVLPDAYNQYLDEFEASEHIPTSFTLCFRTAFNQATEDLKKKVAKRFVQIIKNEGDSVIAAYGRLFFRGSDMKYLDADDVELVKKYLLGRLESNSNEWIQTIVGIGAFVSKDEVVKLTDPLIKAINSQQHNLSLSAQKCLEAEWLIMPFEIDRSVISRIDDWITFYSEKELYAYAEKIKQIKASLESLDFPF